MNYDPKNTGGSWAFDEPDWLADLLAEAEEKPASKATPPAPESPTSKAASVDWREDTHLPPADPKKNPAPEVPSHPKTPPTDWEAARRGGRKSPGQPPRRPSGSRRRRTTNLPLILLIVLLSAGMVFAAWQLGSIFLSYSRDRSAYNDLAANALIQGNTEEPGAIVSENETVTDPVLPENATVVSEIPFQVDWDYLSSVNDDIVGWLYCPDTDINYPVVQSPDHDYYLYHSFDGSSNAAGTLFADRDSVAGVTQSNLIIYGHNMKDGSMFGTLKGYVDESYYDEHPIFYYLTPSQSYRVELLWAQVVDATDENYQTYFSSASAQQSYLNSLSSGAYWINRDALTTEYQLLSMSTCTSSAGQNDPRLLVQGIMIPIQ